MGKEPAEAGLGTSSDTVRFDWSESERFDSGSLSVPGYCK